MPGQGQLGEEPDAGRGPGASPAPEEPGPSASDTGPPLVAIVGPTAAGKSEVAIELARRGICGREVEIVAADAFTVYRGMDLGTAKPDPEVLAEIPHHMVDVLDPSKEASVAWFQREARRAIHDVLRRGRVPLLVGGSGLYFRAAVDELRFPPTDLYVRAAIRMEYEHDPPAAHAALAEVDPAAAERIDPSNLRRSVRALEVIQLTGQPFSSFADEWERYRSRYPHLVVLGLDLPPPELRAVISARAESMVMAGLLEEVRALHAASRPLSLTARQAIGYAEAFAVLQGELDEEDLAASIRDRTWRYARRQRTWFRKDPRVRWVSREEALQFDL